MIDLLNLKWIMGLDRKVTISQPKIFFVNCRNFSHIKSALKSEFFFRFELKSGSYLFILPTLKCINIVRLVSGREHFDFMKFDPRSGKLVQKLRSKEEHSLDFYRKWHPFDQNS